MLKAVKASCCLAAVLAVSGCGSSTPAAPTTPGTLTTETFTGTLPTGGGMIHNFTTATVGTATITLVSLSPQAAITMGLAFGNASAAGCTPTTNVQTAMVGFVFSGTLSPGNYCVAIYDVGNLTGPEDYNITAAHY
jgi:hypothetical protein